MSTLITKEINSLEDLKRTIASDRLSPDNTLLYRGQSNSEWGLIPTLFREKKDKLISVQDFLVQNNINDPEYNTKFIFNSFEWPPFETDNPEKYKSWKKILTKLCTSRHKGQLSPILDFTYDLNIALSFAIKNAKEDFSIFVLDPKGDMIETSPGVKISPKGGTYLDEDLIPTGYWLAYGDVEQNNQCTRYKKQNAITIVGLKNTQDNIFFCQPERVFQAVDLPYKIYKYVIKTNSLDLDAINKWLEEKGLNQENLLS